MRHIIFILFSFFSFQHVFAQIEDTIQKRLFQKDFNSFKAYTDQMPGQKSKCHWTCIRNVAGNYNEGVFYFQKSAPTLGEDAYHKTTFYYRVQVLFVESKFIYFNLGELND